MGVRGGGGCGSSGGGGGGGVGARACGAACRVVGWLGGDCVGSVGGVEKNLTKWGLFCMSCLRFLGGVVLGDCVSLLLGDCVSLQSRCVVRMFLFTYDRLLWCVQKAIHVFCAMIDVLKVP